MIKYILFIGALVFATNLSGQEVEKKIRKPLYSVDADPEEQLSRAMIQAKKENKHILLKIGGNWCKWCYYFHDFIEEHEDVKSLLDTHYVTININHSRENGNLEFMERLQFPQRFGFPVVVILDKEGNRLHTQSTQYLESDDSYDAKEVMTFLNLWSPGALNPIFYKKKDDK